MRRTALQAFIPQPTENDLAPRNRSVKPEWFTMKQVAERLGLAEITIRTRIRHGTIAAQKFGRSVRISAAELQRLETEGWK